LSIPLSLSLSKRTEVPAILRVNRIKTRTDIRGGARITYGNGREYEVTENCFQIGKMINEVTKK